MWIAKWIVRKCGINLEAAIREVIEERFEELTGVRKLTETMLRERSNEAVRAINFKPLLEVAIKDRINDTVPRLDIAGTPVDSWIIGQHLYEIKRRMKELIDDIETIQQEREDYRDDFDDDFDTNQDEE